MTGNGIDFGWLARVTHLPTWTGWADISRAARGGDWW